MSSLNIARERFHGDWNYTIHPEGRKRDESFVFNEALTMRLLPWTCGSPTSGDAGTSACAAKKIVFDRFHSWGM